MNTMKRFFALALGVSVLAPAQGQLFTPEGLSGAAWGGLVGGIIGHNSGRKTGEGIAIGAGAGYLLGTLAYHSRAERAYYSSYEPTYVHTGYYDPDWYYTGPAYYEPYRPSHAFQGAVIGGIAGGIIGDNNHHHGLEGAAIGVGAGLLLGGLSDYFTYRHERARARRVYADYRLRSAPVAEAPAPAAPSPHTNTVTTVRPASPMSGVNALFGR